eukprot:snap_masked-scaffold_70-processed-gene-0.70-mRNA-1 protein AED:1.00 eAED:1.00 QI:0/-1/0/0/-1/1/1/0/177
MEALGKTVSNESIIKYLKEKLKKNKIREDLTIGEMIKKYVEFIEDIEPEEAVELIFIKVSKLVAELPPSAEIKPKQKAKAIFSILPNYIWVRHKDLETRNDLKSKDRKNLKKYIMSCIPPEHVIARAKEMNVTRIAVKKTDYGGECRFQEKYLCLYCFSFGHHEARCWLKKTWQAEI